MKRFFLTCGVLAYLCAIFITSYALPSKAAEQTIKGGFYKTAYDGSNISNINLASGGVMLNIYTASGLVTANVETIRMSQNSNIASFISYADEVATIDVVSTLDREKNYFCTADGEELRFASNLARNRFLSYFEPLYEVVTPPSFLPGTIQLQDTRLVVNNEVAALTSAVKVNYTVLPAAGDTLLNLSMSFVIPGIFTVDGQKYVFDGNANHIALYQDYDGVRIQNPSVTITLRGQNWNIAWNAYATNTSANRAKEWNWLAEQVYYYQTFNGTTDITTPSYYVLYLSVKPTDADDIIDALADIGTSISELTDTYTEIRDYVPPAADDVQSDAEKNASAADAAAAVVPELSNNLKEQFNDVQEDKALAFAQALENADVDAISSFFSQLSDNVWFVIFVIVPIFFALFAWLIKWASD